SSVSKECIHISRDRHAPAGKAPPASSGRCRVRHCDLSYLFCDASQGASLKLLSAVGCGQNAAAAPARGVADVQDVGARAMVAKAAQARSGAEFLTTSSAR